MALSDWKQAHSVKPLHGPTIDLMRIYTVIGAIILAFVSSGANAAGPPIQISNPQTGASNDKIPQGYNQRELIACKEKARPVADRGALGVCEREDHDKGLWYSHVPYVTTVIYDSTDELRRESSKRSNEWKTVARSLAKEAPFGILGFHNITRLGGHYYKVTFDAQYQADCCW
jgi:hypothetical protein